MSDKKKGRPMGTEKKINLIQEALEGNICMNTAGMENYRPIIEDEINRKLLEQKLVKLLIDA